MRVAHWAWILGVVLACGGDKDGTGTDGDLVELDADSDADADADSDADSDADTDTDSDADTDTSDTAGVLPPYSADYLWDDILFVGAVDLGHTPAASATPVQAGSLVMSEIAPSAGLGGSNAGGDSHGVGVGFFDVDGDTWADIFIINGVSGGTTHRSELWHNNQDGTFSDVTQTSGVREALAGLSGYSIAAADYDADGDLDVLVTGNPRDRLLQNDGAGNFTDVSSTAGVSGPTSDANGNGSKIGAWGDFDNDGWMDIAVVSTQFSGGSQPENGYLLHNEGNGTFADITSTPGFQISDSGNPCALIWSDFDNDGDQDLLSFNDRGNSSTNRTLLRNDGGAAFTDITQTAGWENAPAGNPMGIDGADLDHNGYLDYYVGNIGGNLLLMGSSTGLFIDESASAGTLADYGWGLGFEDFNLDGWWDIFNAQEDDRDYLTFTNRQTVPVTFVEQGWEHGPANGNAHNVAAAFADYDHDGDTDVVTAGTGGNRVSLFRNDTDRGTNHWLNVVVPVDPIIGSIGGISARVVVQTPDRTWFEDLTAGSSRASQNEMSARFGLGDWDGATWVAVLWPDGRQSVVTNVPGDQVLEMP